MEFDLKNSVAAKVQEKTKIIQSQFDSQKIEIMGLKEERLRLEYDKKRLFQQLEVLKNKYSSEHQQIIALEEQINNFSIDQNEL